MKNLFPLLALYLVAAVTLSAIELLAAPTTKSDFKPTWDGDKHDVTVYTSRTNVPAVNKWLDTNIVPVMPRMTNWPVTNLPPSTNWPGKDLPALTNSPSLEPPGKSSEH